VITSVLYCILQYILSENRINAPAQMLSKEFRPMMTSRGPQNSIIQIRPELAISLFLIIAILIVYWQVNNYDFTRYDDGVYVYNNRYIQDGLTFSNVRWAFTTTYFANWHPLTWISYMVDITLYGMNPGQHHLTNVLLHIANTLLLFYLLKYSTGKLWRSGFVAALFALHPLHVESVAWISERKDLLSGFWGILVFLCYVHFVKKKKNNYYLLALVCFLASLMSKPMLVTLPFLLLLVDYWPLGRLRLLTNRKKISVEDNNQFVPVSNVILEKLPFLILAVLSGIMTLNAQQAANAVASLELFPLTIRIANALVSYVHYICKMILPCGLAVFYPHPGTIPLWQVVGATLFLVTVSLVVFYWGRRQPYLIIGWLWYLGSLTPVIGFIQVGSQAMADRYTYMPLIGLLIIITWGASEFFEYITYCKTMIFTLSSVIIIILMIISHLQVHYWKNDISLFQHALDVTHRNYVAHNNLGLALAEKGKLSDAILHYSSALKINASHKSAHNNWGIVLAAQGHFDEATTHFQDAIQIDPNFEDAHNNLGYIFATHGKLDEAIHQYLLALRQYPAFSKARNNLAKALFLKGRINEAIYQYSETLRMEPENAIARNNLRILKDGQSK